MSFFTAFNAGATLLCCFGFVLFIVLAVVNAQLGDSKSFVKNMYIALCAAVLGSMNFAWFLYRAF